MGRTRALPRHKGLVASAGGPGARVATSAWAQVVAYDETGGVLAVSEPVSVGPVG